MPRLRYLVFLQLTVFGALSCGGALGQRAHSDIATGIFGEKDQRIQITSDRWPWSAIGRINVLAGTGRQLCTGSVIGPRQVLTAAQCLFDAGINNWVKAGSVHFVLGQTGDKYVGHSVVESFLKSPEFAYRLEDRPRWDMIDPKMIRHNWAILNMRDELPVKPIPLRAINNNSELPPEIDGEIALAGYASDREYVISLHKGCVAKVDVDSPGVITHKCDTIGESGAPILLLKNNEASIIGIHSSIVYDFQPQLGYSPLFAQGVSISEAKTVLKNR
jgi:protease YdgD